MDSFQKIPAYVYPNSSRNTSIVKNPYLDNFIHSTGIFFNFLNKEKTSSYGIFDIFKYLHKIDYIFFNWIENVPEKKGGIFQTLIVLFLLFSKHLFSIKIVWTMHNKISHSKEKFFIKKLIFKKLLFHSDFIITHSKEGLNFAEDIFPGTSKKILYFPHPVIQNSQKNIIQIEKDYDILIWGSLSPYKGIEKFLLFLKNLKIEYFFRILIIGKPSSLNYFNELLSFQNEKCQIIGKYVEFDELKALIQKSHIVLFTYSEDSVLSSGALMDSISLYASVIGPNLGSFADLAELGIVKTYDDFYQLIDLIKDECISNGKLNFTNKIEYFIQNNTWSKFAEALASKVL